MEKECPKCNKLKTKFVKGVCNPCYRRCFWKRKLKKCNRCERTLPLQAKGLCGGCYNTTFHLDRVKKINARKRYNLDFETYEEITKECAICKFNKVVDLHHIDHNHSNNSIENLVGLCPNHHKLIHVERYRLEIMEMLKQIGKCPQDENLPKMSQRHR